MKGGPENRTLATALAFAAHGLAVFPVAANCRTPRTTHGYKDASKDPAIIRAWWDANPFANLAVATGHLSGVFVLDVDVKGANGIRTVAELEHANAPLPKTWRTRTPSGGAHIWFRQPDRTFRNRVGFAPGLDVRTCGGSVAAPPSEKDGRPYSWEAQPSQTPLADAPDWLIDLIDPPPVERPPSQPIRVNSLDRLARYAATAINAEAAEVAKTAANTGRNARLFKAACRLGEIVGAGMAPQDMVEDALETAAHECGLVAEDGLHGVRATISSGLQRGIANPREVRA